MNTRAICDQKNNCQDYEIYCKENKISKVSPTGMIIQLPDNWVDPRNNPELSC